ncbi:hypothetical protein SAMN05216238_10592 [Lentibacillus persicus]|uniref:Amidohydrolase 3 domain-containing protein n=1 Tax=Lentibacillus persicus TaxID=640948 RepID=A0A1I1VXJ6_9BACI|nr:amidohydrolase [Lentibacillus persicus]SFD87816.1 hypothetical protein SAMN05216238_10592 [Lentibacillus persicus]
MSKFDLIMINGNILTLDDHDTIAGSVAVKNGCITEIWPQRNPPIDIAKLSDETEVIDLKGDTLIPGFIDTHNHILQFSQLQGKVNCSSPLNKNINDILSNLASKVAETPKGEWVTGFGYDDTLLEDYRHPERKDLDKVSPEHPVMIQHISGHIEVVNSKAIELAGISESTPVSKGGSFGFDNKGILNGVLYERPAIDYIYAILPKDTEETLIKKMEKASKHYLSQGITTNTDAGVGTTLGEIEFDIHVKAAQQGVNPIRTRLMIFHTLLRENAKFGNYTAEELDVYIKEQTNELIELDSAKLFQDGSIQGLTGALRKPYHCDSSIFGELMFDQEQFNEEVLALHKRGFRIAVHGNGDRAIGSILEAYDKALQRYPKKDHRHRIEHAQTATNEDLDKIQELGVAASFFINHVYYWGDRHKNIFLGEDRANRMNPLSEAVGRNLLFTLHSDCPITPISPLFSIWTAVNRVTREGRLLGANQRCDVKTALKAMTIYGAKLNFSQERTGSIEVGKYADFAVLDRDPIQVDPMEIKNINVLKTIIGGKMVFEKF